MTEGSFADGYADGWQSIAGDHPMPENPTYPPEGEPRDFKAGFFYGRSDAAERFKPGT